MYLMHNFYIFVTALFMSLVMVPAIRKWAIDAGVVDYPDERRVNIRPIPSVGGVAIFIPFLFSVLVYFDMNREVRGVLAGSLIIFFTGLIDDLYDLSPRQKFVGQIAGCLVAVLVGHLYLTHLGNLFGGGQIVLPFWAGGGLALFALVGVVNAVNLMDGLDGLAGGVSTISLLAFFWLGFLGHNFTVLALSAGLLGGLLGFLKYNAFPARIFMGDTGSLVVGFVLGSIAILLTQGSTGSENAIVPLVILSVPITDTLAVMLSRLLRGRSPLSSDRTHLHHKIMALGLGHALTVLLIYSLSLFWVLVVFAFRSSEDYYLFGGLVLGTLLVHLVLNILLKHKDFLQGVSCRLLDRQRALHRYGLSTYLGSIINLLIVLCLALYALAAVLVSEGQLTRQIMFLAVGVVAINFVLMVFEKHFKTLLLPILLAPVFFVNFWIESFGNSSFWMGVSFAQLTNFIFLILSFLLAVKFVLLKSIDEVLSYTMVFVLLVLGMTLAVVSHDMDLTYHLSGIISKGIVVLLALKFLTIGSRKKLLVASALLNLTLLATLLGSIPG